ncbi:MAG: TlpA disulfide reductase family protein, partial [Myxococcota bacterium]|nr:TlpA disulfide reductase family protein [Myxococcota bacterium]
MTEPTPPQARDASARPPKKASRGTIIAVTLGMLLVGMMVVTTSKVGKRAMARWQVEDQNAPNVALVDVRTNRRISTQDFHGKVVLLDFWATWCPPCRKQMPAIEKIATDASLSDKVAVLSINTDEIEPARRGKVRSYLNKYKYTMTTLLDDGRASRAYHVFSIPTLVVIDKKGNVHSLKHGVHSEDELREIID